MRYAFINNFEQILAQAVADTDTTITLDGGGSQMSNASADLVYVLTLFHVDSNGNETAREIVHVTGVSGDTLTVERAKEGTTAQAWAVGDGVSQRLTAEVLGRYELLPRLPADHDAEAIRWVGLDHDMSKLTPTGLQYWAADTLVIGQAPELYDGASEYWGGSTVVGSWAIGRGSGVTAVGAYAGSPYGDDCDESTALGAYAVAAALGATAVGAMPEAFGEKSIAIGYDAAVGSQSGDPQADGMGAIAAGAGASATKNYGVALGAGASASGVEAVAVGRQSGASADYAGALGPASAATAVRASAFGVFARASAVESVALGPGPDTTLEGGMTMGALPYVAKVPVSAGWESGYTSPAACRQSAAQVVLATHALDLTTAGDTVTLDMPANAMLFIDSIDVVIVASDTAGGSPEISVGPDDVTPAAYLASTPVTKTAVGGRESHTPLVADGVTSLRVATAVAGTGTTYQAKIVFRGYVMEL
ncbi:hypothetical protein EQG41_20880 [Billgrantia azerbaijanica]|nr:hypothetical protein EQG41_20880 [Halomonas azerbaijanica]